MSKKIAAMVLMLVLALHCIPLRSQAQETYIIGNGVEIPNSSVPADGRNPYCNCDSSVGWGSHSCCWNYGYYVYYKVWGEYPERRNSEINTLRNVAAEDRRLTAENLARFLKKAAPGALLRMDRRSSVTFGDDDGHTLVFVQMNAAGDGAVFLEGNYNGKGNSRLVEWDFQDLVDHFGPDSRKDYRYIKYLLWPNAPEYYETYADLCQSLPTYTKVTANTDTVAMALPCDSSVDGESVAVKQVRTGDTYTATDLLRNTDGELWFEITASDRRAFVPAEAMDVTAPVRMDVSISDVSAPTRLSEGSSFSIKGNIRAEHSNLVGVSAYIFKGTDTSAKAVTGGAATVSGQSYSLKGSSVDSKVRFGSLKKGEYTYAVFATLECSYPKANGAVETREQTVCVYQTRFVVGSDSTKTVTVTFDAKGGFSTMDKATLCKGSVLKDLPDACREGYTFQGWSLNGTDPLPEGEKANGNITLKALWLANGAWNCGHRYKTEVAARAASCTQAGNMKYYLCDQCGTALKADGVTATTPEAEVIPALGHDFTEADCVNGSVCRNCGAPGDGALGHEAAKAVRENVVEPTATEDGSYDSVVYCQRCDEELSRIHRTIAALPVLGDVNRDGSIDSVDAVLVLQYAVGLLDDGDISLENADVNGDRSIDTLDAMLILQLAVGMIPGFRKTSLAD